MRGGQQVTNTEILLEAKKAVNKLFSDIPIDNYQEIKTEADEIIKNALLAVTEKDLKAEDEFKIAIRLVTKRIERKKRDIYCDRLIAIFHEYAFKLAFFLLARI